MEFANIMLLFGGFALSVPLIIHLLNRSKIDVVPWAAMHLLQAVELQNQRRIKWRSWLLLFIRCLIPLLLAACMARPLLTAWKTTSGDGQSSLTIVLDNSYSLQAAVESKEPNGESWVRSQVQQILKELGNTTEYSLLSVGAETQNLTEGSTFDYRSVVQKLQQWIPVEETFDPSKALQSARETALASSMSNHQILVISDFQKADWRGLQTSTTDSESQDIQTTFLPVVTSSQENLGIRLTHRYSETLGVNEPLEIRATISNWGLQEQTDIPVDLVVDQQAIASRKVTVAGRGESQVVFGCQFAEAGLHEVKVRIKDDNGWEADNSATLPVTVLDSVQVLLVESDVKSTQTSGSCYWELALRASASLQEGVQPWLQTRRCDVQQLREAWIEEANVIVLTDVRRIDDALRDAISRRVKEGAGLLVIPGPQSDPKWYSQWNHKTASDPEGQSKKLIPAEIGVWQVADDNNLSQPSSSRKQNDPKLSIAAGPYSSPALAFFDSGNQGRLSDIQLFAWAKLKPHNHANIVAKLTNGDPFFVIHSVGQGNVGILAIGSDEQISNFPLRPTFVPFVQRVTIALSGKSNEAPQGNLQTNESRPAYLEKEELATLAQTLDAEIVDNSQQFLNLLQLKQNGREIWRFVLLALVVFLFAELLLQRPFSEGV